VADRRTCGFGIELVLMPIGPNEFVQEPAERPYGMEAIFKDVSGNWFSLTERRG